MSAMARRGAGRLVSRAMGLGLVFGALVLGPLVGAAGAQASPWAAFSANPSSAPTGQTVTLNKVGGDGTALSTLFPGGNWPSSFSAGGVGLTLAPGQSPCSAAAHPSQSCEYVVSGSQGSHQGALFVYPPGASTPNLDPSGYTFEIPPPPTTTTAAPPTTTTTGPPPTTNPPPDATFSPPASGGLTAPSDFVFKSANAPGVVYTWLLLDSNGQQVATATGPNFTLPASLFNRPAGQYNFTLQLTATDAVGSRTNSHNIQINVSAPTPVPPVMSPPSGNSPSPVATPVANPGVTGTVNRSFTYVPPLANFATPTPANLQQQVTVVWLWHPDWFQTSGPVRTTARAAPTKRASVQVGSHSGPSATPWLAGLAVFGIFGGAWIAVRRRRVRLSILD